MSLSSQTILMCPPDYFGVSYVINPWMEGHFTDTNRDLAEKQWNALGDTINEYAKVLVQPAQPNLPDLVFTANAGLVLGGQVIISRFRSPERQGEEKHDHDWFAAQGFEILDWPQEIPFEGAGDALFDRGQPLLWVGHGFRTDARVPPMLEKMLDRKTVALTLIDPRFYHLDTCLCPLAGGYLMYFPQAFNEESQRLIEILVPASKRIPVSESDALKFCCNAVDLDGPVIMNDASDDLQLKLQQEGFSPILTPLSEFLKAGGGAKCLTLKLVEA